MTKWAVLLKPHQVCWPQSHRERDSERNALHLKGICHPIKHVYEAIAIEGAAIRMPKDQKNYSERDIAEKVLDLSYKILLVSGAQRWFSGPPPTTASPPSWSVADH